MIPTTEQVGWLLANIADLEVIPPLNTKSEITPCSELIREHAEIEPHRCYNNMFHLVMLLAVRYEQPVKYVVGIMSGSIVPVCHAWLKIGDEYHDPTIEMLRGFDGTRGYLYQPAAELSLFDLINVTKDNDYRPPCAADIAEKFPEHLI